MKAIILAAGKGTRMRPLTNKIPKPLIPICNLPTLIFVIEKILKSGINNIGLVISPDDQEYFKVFIEEFNLQNSLNLILQKEPLGVAHAVKQAKSFIKDDDFLLYLGDNLIKDNLKIFKEKFENDSVNALLLLKEIDDPKMFGVAEIDSQGKLIGIEEKPLEPKSNLAVSGLYFFKNIILDEIETIEFSERGELEITDAIISLMNKGNINGVKLKGWWIDTGSREQVLEANSLVMTEIFNGQYLDLYTDYDMRDKVLIGLNSNIKNVNINGQVIIGHNTNLISTNIHKNVSISNNSIIKNSIISNSIILEGNHCDNFEIINSLVGSKYKKDVNNKIKDIIDS